MYVYVRLHENRWHNGNDIDSYATDIGYINICGWLNDALTDVSKYRRLVDGFSPRRTGFALRAMGIRFMMNNVALGGSSPNPSLFSCQNHSIVAPYSIMYHLGMENGPVSGRSSTERQSHTIVTKKKKKRHALSNSDYTASNYMMINELKSMWE
jgi:hypothetical protein